MCRRCASSMTVLIRLRGRRVRRSAIQRPGVWGVKAVGSSTSSERSDNFALC